MVPITYDQKNPVGQHFKQPLHYHDMSEGKKWVRVKIQTMFMLNYLVSKNNAMVPLYNCRLYIFFSDCFCSN